MQVMTAPMAGITDYSFRKIMSRFAPDIIFTEMIDVNALKYDNEKTIKKMLRKTGNESVQIFGSEEDDFLRAVKILLDKGFNHIDINMGCPMKKIIRSGKGAALLLKYQYVKKIISDIKKEFGREIKLSLKIRTGYKEFKNPELYVKLAKEYGLYQICIHGRTQEQMYSGESDWKIIKRLKEKYDKVVIIGNGDLLTPEIIKEKIKFSKPDGIMLARGLLGNPWLIKNAKNYFISEENPEYIPDRKEIRDIVTEHINYCIEDKGREKANLDMRKHIFWYFKGFEDIEKIKKDIIKMNNIEDVLKYINYNI